MFRTGALYVLGAWLTLQVADVLFPGFGIPEAAIQALVWAAVLGCPVALAFGWLYEIGPQGIRRTPPTDAEELSEPQPLARRDYLILAAFVAIAGVLVFRAVYDIRETPIASSPDSAAQLPDAGERLENSIAVLPFVNISNDPDNDYFCDGVSEEILDRLASLPELNVIARTSSFAFKDSGYGIDQISALLGVRYVLQGSVRKSGDQLRISAQLVDAGGQQVWSQSFDRRLENIFEIQSEIAGAVAMTVASQVAIHPDAGHQPDLEAYEHYLTGRELVHLRDVDRAQAEFERAIGIDDEFAEAHAELAIAEALGGSPEEMERARRAVERALQLNPHLLRASAAQGFVLMAGVPADLTGAERALREVLARDPSMSDALLWLHNTLAIQGRDDQARVILERAALIDPLHPSIAVTLASNLLEEGQPERARRIYERLLAQPTPGPVALSAAGGFYGSIGQLGELTARSREAALREPSFRYLFLLLQACAELGDWELTDAVNDRLLSVPAQGPGLIYRQAFLPELKNQTDVALQRVRDAFDELGVQVSDLDPFAKAIAGSHFARGGDYAAAIEALQSIVNVESPYQGPKPDVFSPPAHSLAWSYLHTGADVKASHLLTAVSKQCTTARAEGRFGDSSSLHHCAEAELLRGNTEAALDGLEQAIQAGWRNYYFQESDPYWASVASDPRYRALMAQVKADVDEQRAAVQRAESDEDFLAKLDAAIAMARAAPPQVNARQ